MRMGSIWRHVPTRGSLNSISRPRELKNAADLLDFARVLAILLVIVALVLANEPVTSLDPANADAILGLLRNLARHGGLAVLAACRT